MDKDNSYTISFGAFDSELKGWEYTIPEGMEAEIKNGKIIVREKESEDERIRKVLYGWVYTMPSSNFEGGFSREEILSYLDKQGSQNLANSAKTCKDEPKFKVWDVIRNKWSNRTKTIIAIDNSQYTLDDGMPAQPLKVNIKAQDNWEFVEQNFAWSEEDERNINGILMVLESWDRYHVSSAGLPSLIPQYISWLKSLKERCTWKPSDEQMELLREVQQALLGKDCHNRFVNFMYELKRLKG